VISDRFWQVFSREGLTSASIEITAAGAAAGAGEVAGCSELMVLLDSIDVVDLNCTYFDVAGRCDKFNNRSM